MSSPWDYTPPEEMPGAGVKEWSYLGFLGYFGVTMLATFGALFLLILFVILTTAFWEWTGQASSDTLNSSENDYKDRAPIQYNFNIPESSEVHFHANPNGHIRQIVARPVVLNHHMSHDGARHRLPPEDVRSNSASIAEIPRPQLQSMEIQRSFGNRMQEPRRKFRSDSRNIRSLSQPGIPTTSSQRGIIPGRTSNSTNSAPTIQIRRPNVNTGGSRRGSADISDDDE